MEQHPHRRPTPRPAQSRTGQPRTTQPQASQPQPTRPRADQPQSDRPRAARAQGAQSRPTSPRATQPAPRATQPRPRAAQPYDAQQRRGASANRLYQMQQARQARRQRIVVGALCVILVAVGVFFAANALGGAGVTNDATNPDASTNFDAVNPDAASNGEEAAPPVADSIVMTLNGGKDTYVLVGEDFLDGGCHAYDATEGNLSVTTTGEVDTATPGDYTVTYTAALSSGAQATATRTVHVVENFDGFAGNAETLPVLMYHYVYTEDDPPEKEDANYLLDTKLAAQLQYLVDNNYYYPSYAEVRAFAQGTHTLPARSVVLTFDDGQRGFLNYGIPLLEQYEVPATSFIICSQDSTPEKLRDYASPYVSFQSHSYNMHRDGSDVGRGGIIHAMTTEEIVDDLKQAQAILGTTEAFAYPYGDNNENAWAAMEEAGVLCAFTIENRRVEPGDPAEALPRVRIAGEYTQEGFEYLVEPNGGEQ